MLTLIGFAPSFGAPSASSFCVKAQYLLGLSGLEWERKDVADPRPYPKGKLPALDTGTEIIGDSDNIRAWIEAQGIDLDPGLTLRQRAVSRMVIRAAEEHLYFHLLLDRWGNDLAWPDVRQAYFSTFPPVLRRLVPAMLRRKQMQGMHTQGLGRLSVAERMTRIEPDLRAIADMLSGQPFLFGAVPTAADASVAPILDGMIRTPGGTALAARVAGDNVLSDYAKRVHAALGDRR